MKLLPILAAGAALLLSACANNGLSANAQGPFPMFNNRTHSVEAQPFADLSQRIWDPMAAPTFPCGRSRT